jgi:hypothetical protein
MSANDSCGAPVGGAALAGVDLAKEAVIQGVVTAEVPTGEDGVFRFFAAPGTWTVRALAPRSATAEGSVEAELGKIAEVELALTTS